MKKNLAIAAIVLFTACTSAPKEKEAAATVSKDLTAMDKLSIMETSAMLDNSLDQENLPGFVGVFTKDGVLEVGPSKSAGPKEIEGAFYYMLNTFARGRRHCVTNEIITGNQDEAKMESYLTVINRNDFGRRGSAIQHDVFVKEEGAWKIKHRIIGVDSSFVKGN